MVERDGSGGPEEAGEIRTLLEEGARSIGVSLTEAHFAAFDRYYRELVEWNKRANITALTDPAGAGIKHFVDSLTCVPVITQEGCENLVDVGSGGGFPGVPVKIVRPEINVTLVDSAGKRVEFLEHLTGVLNAPCRIVKARAEEFGALEAERESYDVSVARALARLIVALEYCLPLVRVGGIFVAMKGPEIEDEIEEAVNGLEILGGKIDRVLEFELPRGAGGRSLIVVRKIRQTPSKYPRRPGVPERRPLGR